MTKPDCYRCKYRRSLVGSAHSRCAHPSADTSESNPFMETFAIFASVGRCAPVINKRALKELHVRGSAHGIKHGWFNWPYNYDPTWLEACDGFEEKEEP